MKSALRALKNQLTLLPFLATHRGQASFECPICGYTGPFATKKVLTGNRLHAKCPKCSSLERHRIQRLVVESLCKENELHKARMLHFAPEHFFTDFFRSRVLSYETADIEMKGVDHKVDLRSLPFKDASFDLIYASHVLEHIDDDIKAISEIRRVLSPKGIAVLPVPIVADNTIEYPDPNPFEEYHVRAPGKDYFDRFNDYFGRIDCYHSSDFPVKYQCRIYEDRSKWPIPECPLLHTMAGESHEDMVPVCYVSGNF